MTDNHKELCECDCLNYCGDDPDLSKRKARPCRNAIDWAHEQALAIEAERELQRKVGLFESQAARIAELQLELETARQERNAAGVKARRELMPAYEARIAELEKERDALKVDAERYDFLRCRAELREYSMGFYWYIKTIDAPIGMPVMAATLTNVVDAAIQAAKETRS